MVFHTNAWRWFSAVGAFLVLSVSASSVTAQDVPARLVETKVKSLGKLLDGAEAPFVVSPTGERLAYRRMQDKKCQVVCDGVQGPAYDHVEGGSIGFSADGKRFVYAAGLREQREWRIVCDGREIPRAFPYSVFSPDGSRFAYIEKADNDNGWVVVDGVPFKEAPVYGQILFSPDSKHYAFRVRGAEGYHLVLDGKKGPAFKALGAFAFVGDSGTLAYALQEGDKWFVACGGKKHGGYDEVSNLTLSADGKRLAFKARMGKKWLVGSTEEQGPLFDDVGSPLLSADGGRLAYAAREGRDWFVVRDGEKGAPWKRLSEPVFSPDGQHLAFMVREGAMGFLVCDGRKSASYERIQWIGFSSDGKHLVFVAGRGKERFIVCDGIESPAHADILVPERFAGAPDRLRYVTVDGDEVWLVETAYPAGRQWSDGLAPEQASPR